jgi:hypothetical protein
VTDKEFLQRLVENALDFLDRSLQEIETKPKYSVIHFNAGVELLVKARLMAEHWSLVVSRRQEPDRKRFEAGDFISVTLDEAAQRLENAVQAGLSKRELEAFRALARHRNRMVHFFHEAGDKEGAEELLRAIASEQLVAWFLLQRLISERWADVLSPWVNAIAAFGKRLRELEQFLEIVYDESKAAIEAQVKAGASFRECPSCGFAALELKEEVGELYEGSCFVCKFEGRCLSIECPECEAEVDFFGEGFGRCTSCSKKFEPSDLTDILDEEQRGTKDYFESGMPAHCMNCDGYETVVSHGGMYVCASCFNLYRDDEVGQCGWCASLNAGGDLGESAAIGCVACEGRAGYYRDKDD